MHEDLLQSLVLGERCGLRHTAVQPLFALIWAWQYELNPPNRHQSVPVQTGRQPVFLQTMGKDREQETITPRAWLYFALMCMIFGTTFLAIKIGSNAGVPPFLAAGLRFTSAGTILLLARGRIWSRTHRPSGGLIWRTAILGLLMIGLAFAATYLAADYIGSGQLAQIQAVSPVFVAGLSVVLLRKRLRISHIWGLAFGFSGALLLVGFTGSLGPGYLIGALAALGAETSYSLGAIWYRWAFEERPNATVMNGFSMLFGGSFLLLLAVATGQTRFPFSNEAVGSLLYLIVFGALFGHTLHLWLIANVSPLFASTFLFVSPVIATILGSIVLDETITIFNLVGAASVLLGVFAIQRGEVSHQKFNQEVQSERLPCRSSR
jgi:drug/metabolite transporter (DMT)-like permease